MEKNVFYRTYPSWIFYRICPSCKEETYSDTEKGEDYCWYCHKFIGDEKVISEEVVEITNEKVDNK